ncbi:MAG TPA: LCP family protein [Actinomycetota bacterium]|nr:LCP family protein [Actinomycetota bacterium]
MKRAVGAVAVVAVAATVGVQALGANGRSGPARAADLVEIHSAHGASYVPALQGKRPLFILAMGSDARPGQSVAGQRADSIHIIGVDLKRHRATILGFPRDSWVHIPGHGTTKINTAMTLGGPRLMVRTVESITGIRMDFWMLTSFGGLIRMVNGVGGFKVYVPRPMHDRFSGANFRKGTQHFSGREALAFARDRHDVPGGDFGRSRNQGRLMLAALSQLHRVFKNSPGRIFEWIAVGWRNIRTDLSVNTLLDLALTATSIPPKNVRNLVVPARTGQVGSASVVFISSSARRIYADMRRDGVVG